jgi:hypothetical protein
MLRTAGPLLALAACWRDAAPLPPLRGDPRAPEPPPPEQISWHGTCGDPSYGWHEAIAVTLTIRDDGRELVATGTLAFADRRTRAKLRGPHLRGARHTLRGRMREIEGMGTSWGLILEVEPGPTSIRGRFIEVIDFGGEAEMCRFAWTR